MNRRSKSECKLRKLHCSPVGPSPCGLCQLRFLFVVCREAGSRGDRAVTHRLKATGDFAFSGLPQLSPRGQLLEREAVLLPRIAEDMQRYLCFSLAGLAVLKLFACLYRG